MPITLGINISSLQAQRRLSDATSSTSRIFEQLSSGLRINRISDDAAGMAVAEDLNLQTRVYSKAILNGNDAQSILSIADSTLGQLGSIVTRIRELATQSANGTFGNSQRDSLNDEAQALAKEFFRISRSAEFNGINLFDGSLSDGIRFQLGFGVDGSIKSRLGGSLGTGTFANKVSYNQSGTNASDIALGDINGDGIQDMVTTGSTGVTGFATIRLGNGDGTFGTSTTLNPSATELRAVALNDVNNDGILDLIASGTTVGGGVTAIWIGNGNGTFGASTTSLSEIGGSTYSVRIADVNGDGNQDIVTAGTTGAAGVMSVRLGSGSGTFGSVTSFLIGSNAIADFQVGDLNGDGILDIATVEGIRNGNNIIRLGNGDGSFGSQASFASGFTYGTALELADINNDGILDLLTSGVNGSGYVNAQIGSGTGTFGAITSYAQGNITNGITLGDVNGDGNLDLISSGMLVSDGYLNIQLGTGTGTFGGILSYIADSAATTGAAVGDINRDGVLDIVTSGTIDGADGAVGSSTTFLGATRDGVAPILPFSLTTKAASMQAMSMLDTAMQNLSNQRGVVGAFQSRLNIAIGNLQTAKESFTAARSRIIDVDVASASADLVRTQILQKSAIAILAQANQTPDLAIKLLRSD